MAEAEKLGKQVIDHLLVRGWLRCIRKIIPRLAAGVLQEPVGLSIAMRIFTGLWTLLPAASDLCVGRPARRFASKSGGVLRA